MAYPNGLSLAVITSGNAFSAFGSDEPLTVEVTPVFPAPGGGTLRRIVHEPSGWVMSNQTAQFKANAGGGIGFSVPHVDQAGFRDPSGNAYTGWHYKVKTTLGAGRNEAYENTVRPVTGQALVDLDLVPEGEPGASSSVPAPAVTSVNGLTGAVIISGEAATDSALAANLAEAKAYTEDYALPLVTTEADYAHAFADTNGLVALGVKSDGAVEVQGTDLVGMPASSDYLHAFGDSEGRIAFGVRSDGTVEAGGEPVAVKAALKETAWALTVSGGGGVMGEDTRASVTARIPVASGARFRVKAIHIRNYNDRSGIAYNGSLNMAGLWWGEHDQTTTGELTGNFTAPPTQVAGPFTTASGGAQSVIPVDFWVEPGVEYLFSYGYDKDGTANHQGIGGCWTTNSSADAGAQTVAGTKAKFAPLDIWFEIETEARVVAWCGDSLSCGVSSELPVYHSVPMVHARANHYIPQMYTHSGSLMTSWTNNLAWKYTKWAGLDKADALVFSLGKNDFLNTTDTAVLRQRFADVYPVLTSYTTGNLYTTTVLPSVDDTTNTEGPARRAWNDILRNELLGNARMVFDFSAVVSDPGTGNLRPEFDSGDGVHLNKRGYMELARSVTPTL